MGVGTAGFVRFALTPVLALALVLGFPACERADDAQPPPAVQAPEVKAPKERLAEFSIGKPEVFWKGIARELALDGPLQRGLALPLVHALGLPIETVGTLETELPVHGLVLEQAAGDAVLVAVHLRGSSDFVGRLTLGARPTHRVEQGPGSLRFLVATSSSKTDDTGPVLGVLDSYLVIANARAEVERGAEYLVRGLAKNATAPNPEFRLRVERAGLRTLIAQLGERITLLEKRLKAVLELESERRDHRPADFADPNVAFEAFSRGLRAAIALFDSAEKLEISARGIDGGLQIVADFGFPGGSAASKRFQAETKDEARALLALPASTTIALLSNDRPEAREHTAEEVTNQLSQLFGARLTAAHASELERVLISGARGRGDTLSLGFVPGAEPALVVQTSVADPESLSSAIDGAFALGRTPAFTEPLESAFGRFRVERAKASGEHALEGSARLLWSSGPLSHSALRVSWSQRADTFSFSTALVAAAAKAVPAPSGGERTKTPEPEPLLGEGDPDLRRAIERFRRVSVAGFVRSDWLGIADETTPGSKRLLFALGATEARDRAELVLELEAGAGLVKSALHQLLH
jgi:hypothetical protein